MNSPVRDDAHNAKQVHLPLAGRRRVSPAQRAARDTFAAEWGGKDGLIATQATAAKAA